MSHKTKIKAGGSTPPSVEELIRTNSKTRVLVASPKRYVVSEGGPFSLPVFSKPLTREVVLDTLVRQAKS